jgi:hypothetical protein
MSMKRSHLFATVSVLLMAAPSGAATEWLDEEPHEETWDHVNAFYDVVSQVAPGPATPACDPDAFYPAIVVYIGHPVTYSVQVPLMDAGYVLNLGEGTNAFLARADIEYYYRVTGTLGDVCTILPVPV